MPYQFIDEHGHTSSVYLENQFLGALRILRQDSSFSKQIRGLKKCGDFIILTPEQVKDYIEFLRKREKSHAFNVWVGGHRRLLKDMRAFLSSVIGSVQVIYVLVSPRQEYILYKRFAEPMITQPNAVWAILLLLFMLITSWIGQHTISTVIYAILLSFLLSLILFITLKDR